MIPGGDRPIKLEWGACVYASVAAGIVNLLVEVAPGSGGGIGAFVLLQRAQYKSALANDIGELNKSVRLAPLSTDRTVKMRFASITNNNVNLQGQVAGQHSYLYASRV